MIHKNPSAKWSLVWKCVIVGFAAGFIASLYRIGIGYGTNFAIFAYAFLRDNTLFIPLWILFAVVSGLVIHRMIVWEPSASGSGIPQVKGNIMFGLKMNWLRILIARFSGGIMGALFGLSVGREGPSVHIGAATAKPFSDRVKNKEAEKRLLITSGAAAGLSATFNAPISGMIFAMEEIHHSFSEYVLLAGITASLTADIVSSYIFGMSPVLNFMEIPEVSIDICIWLIPVGITAGILGWVMNSSFIRIQAFYKRFPAWEGPVIAILIALPIGMFLPDALGGGEELVEIAERAEIGIAMIMTLLVVKIVFSGTSFGSGVPGGIFMPILACGALGGTAIGLIATEVGMPVKYVCDCAVFCMAGTLASSLRAPVTAIFLVTEMTGVFVHFLPVTVCVLIAYMISGFMGTHPIYDTLLDNYIREHPKVKDGAGESFVCILPKES